MTGIRNILWYALDTHLEEWELLIKERLAHRRVENAEEGSLSPYADVNVSARGHAWLWVDNGGGGRGEVGRSIEIQEDTRGGYAV